VIFADFVLFFVLLAVTSGAAQNHFDIVPFST